MTTTTETTLHAIIDQCIASALAEGCDVESYELTETDCTYVCEKFGRKPRREEWADAGYRYVGGKHVAETVAEVETRWRTLWSNPWKRYEAALVVKELRHLREVARAELETAGQTPPASDEAYRRAWYESTRPLGSRGAPEHVRDQWYGETRR